MKTKAKTYPIQVRRFLPGFSSWHKNENGIVGNGVVAYVVSDTVHRTLRAEQIGNFCPLFCRYAKNPRVLVHSDAGDLSDPFRRDETYANTLWIKGEPISASEAQGMRSAGLL